MAQIYKPSTVAGRSSIYRSPSQDLTMDDVVNMDNVIDMDTLVETESVT